jgi:hypothetical protein
MSCQKRFPAGPTAAWAFTRGAPAIIKTGKTVGDIVGAFKSVSTAQYWREQDDRQQFVGELWQRNYPEHIICRWHVL